MVAHGRKMPVTYVTCFLSLLLFITLVPLFSQRENILFKHITLADGLSQNSVVDICQDSTGFMWFATRDGLNRFDGYQFKIYRHNPLKTGTISDNYAIFLFEDRHKDLWIGTLDGGLNRFDRDTDIFTAFKNDPLNPRSLSDNSITSMCEDRNGTLWVGTKNGLNRFHREKGEFTRYTHDRTDGDSLTNNEITAICEDRYGLLWVGTGDGLDTFLPDSGRFIHYKPEPSRTDSISHNYITTIYEDRTGTLWVGTAGGGLNRFDRQSWGFKHYVHTPGNPYSLGNNYISDIYEDTSGILWVGTYEGISRFEREQGTFVRYIYDPTDPKSISNNRVNSIYEDRSGVLWFGTDGGGLNCFDRESRYFVHYTHNAGNRNSINQKEVLSIYEDRSRGLWIGTYGGLNRIDRKRRQFKVYTHNTANPFSLSHNRVNAIFEDRAGVLWVGTQEGGLNRFDRKMEKFSRYQHDETDSHSLGDNRVSTIYEDHLGVLWIGTFGGLNRLVKDKNQFISYAFPPDTPDYFKNNTVMTIYEDRQGVLWIGTYGGLHRLHRESGTFTRYTHNPDDLQSLSHNRVLSIHEDRSGVMWIGTYGGLNKFDRKNGRFKHFGVTDGLPNNLILGILEDAGGSLWMSTNKGISRFDPRNETFKNYDEDDGLQSNEFFARSYFQNDRGEMFFGGINGFNAFFPDQIMKNIYEPPVVITDFLLFNQPVPLQREKKDSPLQKVIHATREITLSYRDNVITFEFSALHYANPKKNRYRYKLEGWDKDWLETDSKHRRATYTNLPAGEYTFRVQGSNKDGVWNEEGTSVRVTVLPPPWKTWWAYSLYLLLLAGLVFWFVQSQRRKVINEHAMVQRLTQVDRIKDEFLSNTSHELRTPLNGIIGLAESLIDGVTGELPKETKSHLSLIASSGKRLANLVNDILDFSRLRNNSLELHKNAVDLRALTDVVLTLSRPLIGSKNLELINDINADLEPVNADENRVQQIMHNLVGNAVKFTESGSVKVTARVEKSMIAVQVADTGVGIPRDKLKTIFRSFEQVEGSDTRIFEGTGLGLTVSKQLVELHGGTIRAESWEGKGTTIIFTLPVYKEKPGQKRAKDLAAPAPKTYTPAPVQELALGEQAVTNNGTEDSAQFHVLVVDDDPVNRQVILNHLAMQNYAVTVVPSGSEALKALENDSSFDLVILDIMMPYMSGYEVCRKIRERFPAHELPVIFLTAKNQVTDLIGGFSSGANDFISKPVAKSELLARIHTHLQLLEINRNLEEKVEERTRELKDKNLQITSSIQYARTIQAAILPVHEELIQALPDYFVMFQPKDIVSGDFYWLYAVKDMVFLAVVDCTGHGVPAAFMSMMGSTLLDKVIIEQEIEEPALILKQLNIEVRGMLKQEQTPATTSDGMDVCLCRIHPLQRKLYFCGAKSPLYRIKAADGSAKLELFKGDKILIGGRKEKQDRNFITREVELAAGDMIYLTTDGFIDQSNNKQKKYGSKRFKRLLENISHQDPEIQKQLLMAELIAFQGDEEQRDDITILGIRM
jgi:signal transduction histidine kinase/ligand-binding sensor domain-containing protein/serine phosphatase RsbU (regulator of sigma subunit)